jgi:hypothetical protein
MSWPYYCAKLGDRTNQGEQIIIGTGDPAGSNPGVYMYGIPMTQAQYPISAEGVGDGISITDAGTKLKTSYCRVYIYSQPIGHHHTILEDSTTHRVHNLPVWASGKPGVWCADG